MSTCCRMTRGHALASSPRSLPPRWSQSAILLLTLAGSGPALACSGPTDIVGVVDGVAPSAGDEPASDAPAATPADAAGDIALLLAGRPVPDWAGEAVDWPLSMPLAELFPGTPATDRFDREQSMPEARRRMASAFTRGFARGTSDVGARSLEPDARLLILDEDDAHRLLALMPPDGNPGAERAAIFRDALGDIYRVSLESDEMPLEADECGRMHREAFECAGRGPFD